jgi:hypothetical protein
MSESDRRHVDVERVIRESVQTAVASVGNHNNWQNTVLAIIGICTVASGILFAVIDARTDKKIAPLQSEVALIKNDQSYIRDSVDELKAIMREVEQSLQRK